MTYLTDKLRETAVKVLPKDRYGVMTTESIVAFLGSQERLVKVCKESSCLAELGRQVSADYVAQGRIGRFGPNLTIKMELYNVKTRNLIGSFAGHSKDVFGLLSLIDENASSLFKQVLDESKPQKNEPIPKVKKPEAPKLVVEKPELVKLEPEPMKQVPEKPKVEEPKVEKSSFKTSFWVALGLDVVGAAVIIGGYVKHSQMNTAYDQYYRTGSSNDWNEVESYHNSRNALYIVGGVLLASGIGVHIWF